MQAQHELPTLREELDRKTLTELVRLLGSNEKGETSSVELKRSVDSLWAATAGLVDKDIMDIMSVTLGQIDEGKMFTPAEIENADLLEKMSVVQAENDRLRLRVRKMFEDSTKMKSLEDRNAKLTRAVELLREKLNAN